jgi:hypothetical protein
MLPAYLPPLLGFYVYNRIYFCIYANCLYYTIVFHKNQRFGGADFLSLPSESNPSPIDANFPRRGY